MEKVVVRMSFLRFGVNRFEKEVNDLLGQGWHIDALEVHRLLFRVLLLARLSKE